MGLAIAWVFRHGMPGAIAPCKHHREELDTS